MRPYEFALIIVSLALLFPLVATAQDNFSGDTVIGSSPGQAPDCLTPTRTVPPQTIVGAWNCAALDEVRASRPLRNGPPVVARALAIVHTCIYDA